MVLKFCLPAIDHARGTASRLAVSGSQGTRRRSLGAPRGKEIYCHTRGAAGTPFPPSTVPTHTGGTGRGRPWHGGCFASRPCTRRAAPSRAEAPWMNAERASAEERRPAGYGGTARSRAIGREAARRRERGRRRRARRLLMCNKNRPRGRWCAIRIGPNGHRNLRVARNKSRACWACRPRPDPRRALGAPGAARSRAGHGTPRVEPAGRDPRGPAMGRASPAQPLDRDPSGRHPRLRDRRQGQHRDRGRDDGQSEGSRRKAPCAGRPRHRVHKELRRCPERPRRGEPRARPSRQDAFRPRVQDPLKPTPRS